MFAGCVLFSLSTACGSSSTPGPAPVSLGSPDASTDERECIDDDEDGFGRYCGYRDCDDSDPEITDECFRCNDEEPDEGCPCEPGTEPAECIPPSYEGVENGVRGTYVCSEGTRYCVEGEWGDCKVIGAYVFVPAE
ncbi:MAG: hypothetical protein OXR73_08980 [Myxococcales bacterium]|nr:hypothetical protein [Myxococcales bacterium]